MKCQIVRLFVKFREHGFEIKFPQKMHNTKYPVDGEFTIKLSRLRKPRAKQLNETLLTRPAGKMHNPKDIGRSKQKQNLRTLLDFDED